MRRLALGLIALAWMATTVRTADAHALLVSSDPAGGSAVEGSPASVTLTFTEEPEPSLSTVGVLDTGGRSLRRGPVVGTGDGLRAGVDGLGRGVYTVTWRTVSKVDGHATAGAFAFGVGVAPDVRAVPQREPGPSALAVGGRLVLYLGLLSVTGAAATGLIAFVRAPPPAYRLATAGAATAVLGVVGLAAAQRADSGAPIGALLRTTIGTALVSRFAAAGLALAASLRRRRWTLALSGVAASAAMLVHVSAGHAAASSRPAIALQWMHATAAGIWAGGLAALLLGVRGATDEAKVRAARRFSTLALVCVAVVAATGAVRAVAEVGALTRLLSTPSGRLVSLKSGLLLALVGLGALNRFRHVPASSTSLRGLRRTGTGELGVMIAVLGATALLASVAPAGAARPVQRPVSGSGADFATTVRVRLEVSPGRAGLNEFDVLVTDYDTRRPVRDAEASLRFRFPPRPDVATSTLRLGPAGGGRYRGRGANLSLEGRWTVTALVARGASTAEVPMRIDTRVAPQRVDVLRTPGQPSIRSVDLGSGRACQIYLDPERAGRTDVHATFFERGAELTVADDVTIVATPARGDAASLPVRRFGPGHVVAPATLGAGAWRLDVTATTTSGERVRARVSVKVGS